jgi:hypothetical protein
MKQFRFLFWTACAMTATAAAVAQPLPKVRLQSTFPALTLDRPMWMSEAPDHSGRLFLVEQAGRIRIVRKGGDGAAPASF